MNRVRPPWKNRSMTTPQSYDAIIVGIKEGLTKAAADEHVRAVVISGAGKDFCSGADLSALQKIAGASVAENSEDARSLLELFLLIRQVPVPVIAVLESYCFGAAMERRACRGRRPGAGG